MIQGHPHGIEAHRIAIEHFVVTNIREEKRRCVGEKVPIARPRDRREASEDSAAIAVIVLDAEDRHCSRPFTITALVERRGSKTVACRAVEEAPCQFVVEAGGGDPAAELFDRHRREEARVD